MPIVAYAPALYVGYILIQMATYISDEKTCNLIAEYAELEGKSKTAALRDLLQTEIENARYRAGAKERFEKVMSWLRPRLAKGPSKPLPPGVFDDMFSYIEEEREELARTKRKQRKSA
jgi:hypothetical protein